MLNLQPEEWEPPSFEFSSWAQEDPFRKHYPLWICLVVFHKTQKCFWHTNISTFRQKAASVRISIHLLTWGGYMAEKGVSTSGQEQLGQWFGEAFCFKRSKFGICLLEDRRPQAPLLNHKLPLSCTVVINTNTLCPEQFKRVLKDY